MTSLLSTWFYRFSAIASQAIVATVLSLCSTVSLAQNLDLQPNPSLTPQDVVNFQLTALQDADNGIAATFRFASPANKKITGPLSRFSALFDSPQYEPMLNHRGTEIKLLNNDGLTAELLAGVVDQSGDLHWYRFRLSKQISAPFQHCWMTDAVMAVPHSGRSA